jgi:hypothetical protein
MSESSSVHATFTGIRKGIVSPLLFGVVVLGCSLIALVACSSAQPLPKPEPGILFEFHGYNRGDTRTVFSLAVFEDGEILFTGINKTRVLGEARARVSQEKVREWIRSLVERGALDARERPAFAPFIHSDWVRLTIVADGRRNSYRFDGWNRAHPRIQILDAMIRELDVLKKWVHEESAQ